MILSIGELLADVIESEEDSSVFKFYGGGAPFNVAVNIKSAGGKVGFIGRVGHDPIGKFLIDFANNVNLDYCRIQEDFVRNTTLAFVSLNNGERDFSFFRHDAADYNIDLSELNLNEFNDLNIVHMGSLMLSEKIGQKAAKEIISKVKEENKLLSFDINYRPDVFKNIEQAKTIYKPIIENADIIKFSKEELLLFTGENDLKKAISRVKKENRLILVTLGSKGSYYWLNDIEGEVFSNKVVPIDTTGAGDAFFGVALKELDGIELRLLNKDKLESILTKANLAGAIATQHRGAV